jgi:hypothetical protein
MDKCLWVTPAEMTPFNIPGKSYAEITLFTIPEIRPADYLPV